MNERIFSNKWDKGYLKCERNRSGECSTGTDVCFKCGKKDHFAKECHVEQGNTYVSKSDHRKMDHPRVYIMTAEVNDAKKMFVGKK